MWGEGEFSPSLVWFQCIWLKWSSPMTQLLLLLAGLVVADLGPAWNIGKREEPWQDGQEYSCMEEVGRCPPAAVCDMGYEEGLDEVYLLEVSVV